jgi:hypothetical protein
MLNNFRYDMLIVAVVLLVAATALYFVPVSTKTALAGTQFTTTSRPDWLSAGELYLPAGDSLICTYSSDLPVQIGFAQSSVWVAFQNGSSGSPGLVASGNGEYGTFSITANTGESLFLVGNWSPSITPVLTITITALDAHGYSSYAALLFVAGGGVFAASLTYETVRKRFRKQI